MAPTFRIMARRSDTGETFVCFTRTRGAEAGIARAKADAMVFDIECSEFWAEAL